MAMLLFSNVNIISRFIVKKWILPVVFLVIGFQGVSAQVDYYQEIQPIFNTYCISCHGGLNGVFLSTYDETINSVGAQYGEHIVIPEEPDLSPLVDVIESEEPQYGSRMPPGNPLSNEEVEKIRQWIEEGALEEVATSSLEEPLITGFDLMGNYPNPFNPVTEIRFNLPYQAYYTLQVINTAGQIVYESQNESDEGRINYQVDLAGYPSGVYIYEIIKQSNGGLSGRLSGKMTLLK